ncbi:MAG: glutamine--fructose-6-phosphate transaminase (isomerizing) [Candidatus Omnitrophica bacterium]|nr:glutamine--fructose-6-phosphate transaminase (isomerizing) [Candidatus Omnitrophota bacterium]
MCGIIGYTGKKNVVKVLIDGLTRLEYRGYDSSGIALIKDGKMSVLKKKGKLAVLKEELAKHPISGTTGIGHTRWATHGAPNDVNAHPHLSTGGKIAVVHNGIIENYRALKEELQKKGYKFASETDTEVIVHLVNEYYDGDLLHAVQKTIKRLHGSYAIIVIHQDEEHRIVGARKDSPLILGVKGKECFFASDVPAILEHTKEVIFLENGEIADVSPDGYKIFGPNGKRAVNKPVMINWDISQAEKGGYSHFMLKEIFEQPAILKDIFSKRIVKNEIYFEELCIKPDEFKKITSIAIVACGTAYHAGLTGKYLIESIARVPVWADQASEFRYRDPLVDKNTLLFFGRAHFLRQDVPF